MRTYEASSGAIDMDTLCLNTWRRLTYNLHLSAHEQQVYGLFGKNTPCMHQSLNLRGFNPKGHGHNRECLFTELNDRIDGILHTACQLGHFFFYAESARRTRGVCCETRYGTVLNGRLN